MDPILEEMGRVRDPRDIKYSRFRDWLDYLCTLVVAKDDEIARLKAAAEETRGRKHERP